MEELEQEPELAQTREEELEEAETLVQSYRSLVKYLEWDRLVKEMKIQAERRLHDLMAPVGQAAEGQQVDGMTMVLKTEFEKGVRAGILMTIGLPEAMIEYYDEEAKRLRAEIEIEQGEDTDA